MTSGLPLSVKERAEDTAERKRCFDAEIALMRVCPGAARYSRHSPAERVAARRREARMLGEVETED